MRLAILFLVLASFAQANPILVSGYGSFEYDLTVGGSSDFSISFSGSSADGASNVSVFATCEGLAPSCLGPLLPSFAEIDGMNFGVGFFYFGLGDNGTITGFDSQHIPVVTEQISGFTSTTSLTCVNDNPKMCEGQFLVGAPEPGAAGLAGISLVLLAFIQRARRNPRPRKNDIPLPGERGSAFITRD